MRHASLLTGAAALAVLFAGSLSVQAAATNVRITSRSSGQNNNMLYTYSPTGVLLSSVAIPNSPKGYDQPHDLVVDKAGNTQVVYGGGPYLATYNNSSWTFHTALNYSLFGVTYTGAIATYNNYVYVQSQNSGGSGNGIIRFDTANNYTYTFTQIPDGRGGNYEPQDVTMGMDGKLYGNYYVGGAGGNRIVEFNPDTMAIIKSIDLPAGNKDGDHVAADAQGNILILGSDYFNKYDASGTFIKQIALTGHGDLDISTDGKLLTMQNDIAYTFDTNLNILNSFPVQGANFGEPFVTWDSYQAPVPEPTTALVALVGLAGSSLFRRRQR